MARSRAVRTGGLAVAALLAVGAAVAALAGAFDLAIALVALLLGLGVAVSIDAWSRIRAGAERDKALALQMRGVRTAVRRINALTPEAEATAKARARERDAIGRENAAALRHQTSELEALLQALPRLGAHELLPPSGGFAMNARALAELSDVLLERRPTRVVELGSGTSSVWVARHLESTGGRLVSIEHDERYAAATRAQLARQGLTAIAEVRLAPLRDIGDGRRWYDRAALADLKDIDLLIVDGPPGAVCHHARKPALEVLRDSLRPGAIVMLDDADRSQEQEILAEWTARWPEFTRIDDGYSSLAVLVDEGF